MARPSESEYDPFFAGYVRLVPESKILGPMIDQERDLTELLGSITEAESTVLHPPYTWTVKDVVRHLTDGERVFCYRALRVSRKDQTPLAGYDENLFAESARARDFPLASLAAELLAVRRATIAFFENLPQDCWTNIGTAGGSPISVRALAWIIVGHVRHHGGILRQRLGRTSPPRQ